MATTNTSTKDVSRLEMILDQQYMLRALWKEIEKENNIGNNRKRENVVWRFAFLVAATEATALSLSGIGSIMDKDHCTVLHARKQHEQNFIYDSNYKQVYLMVLEEIQDLMDQYQEQIKEVISKRKIPVTGDKTINAMIDMYERKIDVMKRNYDTQLADYQLKYTRLEKEKNRQQARAEKLNTECLRLKNLL